MGKFPHVLSLGEKYQIIPHNIDSNSIWVEALENRTKGEMILGLTCDLSRMKLCGIISTHQVLENEASTAY